MNKTFKLIFNRVRGCVMVVNELTSACQTGKKAAATVAVATTMMASGVAMAANSPWFDEDSENVYTTEPIMVMNKDHTVYEANPDSAGQVHLYALHKATDTSHPATNPITLTDHNTSLTVTDKEASANAPIIAHAIVVEGGVVSLEGEFVTLSVDNQTTNGSMRSVSSAALAVSNFGAGGNAYVSADDVQINASTASGSLAGVSVEFGGSLEMTSDKVTIQAQSSVDEQPVVFDEWDSRYKVSGLQFDSANQVRTSDNTELNILVNGTGTSDYAADVMGIEGEHDGGDVYFGGPVNVVTQSDAGSNVGIYLASVSVDESPDLGPANVVFNGKTTIKTTAQDAEYAIGVSVGLSDQALSGISVGMLEGEPLKNTVSFNNGLDISVENDGLQAFGITVSNSHMLTDQTANVLNVSGAASVSVLTGSESIGLESNTGSEITFNDDLTVNVSTNLNSSSIINSNHIVAVAEGIDHEDGQMMLLGNLDVNATVSSEVSTQAQYFTIYSRAIHIGDSNGRTIIGSEGTTTKLQASVNGIYGTACALSGFAIGEHEINGNLLEIASSTTEGKAYGIQMEGNYGAEEWLPTGKLTVNAPTTIKATTNGEYQTVGILSRGTDLTFNENVDIETNSAFGAWSRGVRVQGSTGEVTFAKDLSIDINVGASENEVAPLEEERGWGTGSRGIHHEASTHLAIGGDLTLNVEGPTGVRGIDADAGSISVAGNTLIESHRLAQFQAEEANAFAIDASNTSISLGNAEEKTTHIWNVSGYNGNTLGLKVANADVVFENSGIDINVTNQPFDIDALNVVRETEQTNQGYYSDHLITIGNANGIYLDHGASLEIDGNHQLTIDATSYSGGHAVGILAKRTENSYSGEERTYAEIDASTDIDVQSNVRAFGLDIEGNASLVLHGDVDIYAETFGDISEYAVQTVEGIRANWGSDITLTGDVINVTAKGLGNSDNIDINATVSIPNTSVNALRVGGSRVVIGEAPSLEGDDPEAGSIINLKASVDGGYVRGIRLGSGQTEINGQSLNIEAIATNGIARGIEMAWPTSPNPDDRNGTLIVNAPTTILAYSTGGFTAEAFRADGIETVFKENVEMTATSELGGFVRGLRIRNEGANVTFEKDLKLNVTVGSVAEGMPEDRWGGMGVRGIHLQDTDKHLQIEGNLSIAAKGPQMVAGIQANQGSLTAASDSEINVVQENAYPDLSAYAVRVSNAAIQFGNVNHASTHNWTVVGGGVVGTGTAYGLHASSYADVTFDETELYIDVQNAANPSVGIYVDKDSKVAFNCGLLNVTADRALRIEGQLITEDSDVNAQGSIQLAEGGLLTIGEDDSLTITNNAKSTIAGSINASMEIGDGKNELAIPYTGEISFQGGELTISETGRIGANTLMLSEIVVNNYGGAIISESIHLGEGAIWNAFNGSEMQSHTYYFGEGSQYVSSDVDDAGPTFSMGDDQTLYLQGGNFYVKDFASDTKTAYSNIAMEEENSAIYIENAYEFANVSVDHESASLTVQTAKGQLNVENAQVLSGQLSVVNGGSLTSGTLTVGSGASLTIDNGNVVADELELANTVTIANGGVLTTMTDQIFTVGLNAEGSNTDAGALTENGQKITVTGGTLAFNDAFYNLDYATSARDVFNQGDVLVFNGQLYVPSVDPGVPEGSLDYADVVDDANTIMAGVDVYMRGSAIVNDVATIDKSFGSASITVKPAVDSLVINEEEKVTLVGGNGKELVGFNVGNDVTPTVTVKGDLQVGQLGATANSGSLSAALNIAGTGASLTVTEGDYTFGDLSVNQGFVDIDDTGKASFNDVAVNANGALKVDGTLTVDNLDVKLGSLTNANTLHVVNDMAIVSGEVENATNAQLTVGNNFEFTGGTFTNKGEFNTDVALIDGTFVDDAIFNNAGTWTTDSLDIISGQLSNTGTLTLTGDMDVEGIVTNAASKKMTVAGDLSFTGGTFNNEGTFSATDLTVEADATTDVFTNVGTVTAETVALEGGKFSNMGDLDIADELTVTGGILENADDLTIGADLVVAGGSMSNSGVTTVTNALVVGVDSSLTNTNQMNADSVELDGKLINEGDLNVTNNVTAWGATLENYDSITADNLVLTDTEFVNAGSVTVADTVVLGAGSTWSQLDGCQLSAQTAYWMDGSKFMANGTNELAFAGRTDYLQGGQFVHQDGMGNQLQITDLVIKDEANTFVEADYAFENVDVETNSSLTVRSDDAWLDTESVTVGGNLSVTDGGLVTTTQLSNSGSMTIGNGGQVSADEVNFTGTVTLNGNGLLTTYTDQIFTTGLNAYGSNAAPHDLTTSGSNIVFNGGTLAFDDAYYNLVYVQNAGKLFAEGNKLVFNGQLYTGPVTGDNVLHYDDLEDNASLILSTVDVLITNETGNAEFVTDKDFGVSSAILDQGIGQLTIGSKSEVTLVGGANKELVYFANNDESNLVNVEGKLTVGYEGVTDNSGRLSSKLALNGENAELNVNLGQYAFADIDSLGGHITVAGATMSAGNVMLNGGSMNVESGQVTLDNLETSAQVTNDGTINIENQLVVDGGTLTNNDMLSVGNNTSIETGATFTNNETFTSKVMDVIGTFMNAGTAEVTDLTVDGTLENGGTLTVANKTTITESGEFTNEQTFASKVMDVIGTFMNAGTAEVTDLTVEGTLANGDTLTVGNNTSIAEGGTFTNHLSLTSNAMDVAGTFNNVGTAKVETDLTVDGTVQNAGTLTVANKTTIAQSGKFTNNQSFTSKVMDVIGTFTNVGTAEVATDLTVDGTIQNDGTLTVANKTTVGQIGQFTNNQTFTSDVVDVIGAFTNDGTVEAGDLTVAGTFENNDTLAVSNKTTVALGGNLMNLQSFSSKEMEVIGAFGNAGTAEIETDLTVAGTFNNGHTTTVGNNTTIASSGTFTNHLSFTSKAMDVFGTFQSVGTTQIATDLTVDGTIKNAGTLTVVNKTTVGQSGEFTNNQTFTSDILNVAGTFANNVSATTNVADLAMQGVRIENAGTMSVSGSMMVNSGSVDNAEQATMTVAGQLLNLGGDIVNGGTLTTLGDAAFGTIESGVGYAQSGGSITNNATWTASDIATTGGTITNNGELTADSLTLIDSTLSNADDLTLTGSFAAYDSTVTNTGTIETGHTNIHRDSAVTNDKTWNADKFSVNAGQFTNNDGGTLTVARDLSIKSGTFTNAGTITTGKASISGNKNALSDVTLGGTWDATSMTVEQANVTNSGNVNVAGTFELGKGATWSDLGSERVKASNYVWGEGSTYFMNVADANSTLSIVGEKHDFMGGQVVGLKNEMQHAFTDIEIGSQAQVKVGAEYSFNNINVTGGSLELVKNGSLAVTSLVNNGTITIGNGGKLTSTTLDLEGSLTLNHKGTLATFSDQIFAEGLNENGSNTNPTDLTANANKITFNGGSLAINDANYNLVYAQNAADLMGAQNGESVRLVFNGTLNLNPDEPMNPDTPVDIGLIGNSQNLVLSDVDVKVKTYGNETEASIDKSIGVSSVTVEKGVNKVNLETGNTLTLVGGTDAEGNGKELIKSADGAQTPDLAVQGTLQIGQEGATNNGGTLSAKVMLDGKDAALNVGHGQYELKDVASNGGSIVVEESNTSFNNVELQQGSSMALGSGEHMIEQVQVKESSIQAAGSNTTFNNVELQQGSSLALGEGQHVIAQVQAKESSIQAAGSNTTFNNVELQQGSSMELGEGQHVIAQVQAKESSIQAAGNNTTFDNVELQQGSSLALGDGQHVIAQVQAKESSIQAAGSNTMFSNVELQQGSSMELGSGDHVIEKIQVKESSIQVAEGSVSFGKVELLDGSSIDNQGKQASVEEMSLGDGQSQHTVNITGAYDVAKLNGDENTVLNVGTTGEDGKRGDLTLGEESSLNGMTVFLDPAWVDGQTIADASRLVYQNKTVDGKIVIGENSYAVLGGADDSEFLAVFDGQLTWGKDTLAAAYVASAITIDNTTGALYVDGSLTSPTTPNPGTVTFNGNSILVANMTNLAEGTALITANSFDIDAASKAVIVGTLEAGKSYMLTSDTAWTPDQLMAGNAMWDLTFNQDGTFSLVLEKAEQVFGDLMQGSNLADSGMVGTEAEKKYVDSLLTDMSGNVQVNPEVAARFDAAMNPAGALATFTTAYDRANELRQVVREESVTTEGARLWARVTSSDNALKELSTGSQALDIDTSAYGLVIGGEAKLDTLTVGMALTAGFGDTENSAVSAKDDFTYYGVSAYGKGKVGCVDVLADASVMMLKSDMTVGGVANVDTEMDTTVYSLGVQAQKTFAFDAVNVTPFVGVDVYHVRADGYSNGHGAEVGSANATVVEMPFGVTIAKGFETVGGMKIDPSFTFAVVPTLGGGDIDSNVKFAGAESTYNFTYADDVKVRSKFGISATKKNFNFGVSAGYEWGSEQRGTTSIQANMKYMF